MMHPQKKRFDVVNLERILDRELSAEEQNQVSLWEKGRALAQMRAMYGWDVIIEMLQSYPLKAMDELMRMNPSEGPLVNAQQAVAFGAHKVFMNFQADVDAAIEASRQPPDVITEQLRRPTTAPPEL
jgi:hypothetical protein